MFLFYFLITLLIEIPLVLWLVKAPAGSKAEITLVLHLFTWPAMQVAWALTHAELYWLELGVVAVEAVCYNLFFDNGWMRSLFVSLLANGCSYACGLMLNPYF
ncbi:MAG: hypothetical protein K0Q66_1941 [Chitinophagaceae bacterium]|jgi:hypothetical protein|nr:hypothetical protein [Chitinophagaceae bacterium]